MRKLGQALGVEAMALYYHFANRDGSSTASSTSSSGRSTCPPAGGDWKPRCVRAHLGARRVPRHRWAIG